MKRKLIRTLPGYLAEYAQSENKGHYTLHTIVTMSYLWDESAQSLEIHPEALDLENFKLGLASR